MLAFNNVVADLLFVQAELFELVDSLVSAESRLVFLPFSEVGFGPSLKTPFSSLVPTNDCLLLTRHNIFDFEQ